MISYRYPAIRVVQTTPEKALVLFSAPAFQINQWAGVPQKKRFGDEPDSKESVGFQREESASRIGSLKSFFANSENVIQNPLLCAARTSESGLVKFEPLEGTEGDDSCQLGALVLSFESTEHMCFKEVLRRVRVYLEQRVPELKGREPSEQLVSALKERARTNGQLEVDSQASDQNEQPVNESSEGGEASQSDATGILFEESHIVDFWDEIAARHEVSKLIDGEIVGESFLGFSRDALSSYLCPVVLVDGQHRLRGALEAANDVLRGDKVKEEIENRVGAGEEPEKIEADLLNFASRRLPVSLILTTDPSEQVFQFVCVNQKATPIGKALLGTIVSTTLSSDELERVGGRLRAAGIELAESQAISYLAKYPESPFCGLVERGMAGDAKDLLQWGVFGALIEIFRDLRGGKLFHMSTDFADAWKRKSLQNCQIVAGYSDAGYSDKFEYWSSLDGPWRSVFMVFWGKIRDYFGNTTDKDKPNYWGSPRTSNLFNKVSLTVLAADFFEYMHSQKSTLSNADDVNEIIDAWLDGVNKGYFDKDWNLGGIKKDNPGIRKRWASIWFEYRRDPVQLPDRRNYRNAMID